MEIWNSIFNNHSVSNHGRIRNDITGKIRKPVVTKLGYQQIKIVGKMYLLHRLIAIGFIPNPNNLPEVNHKNGIKTDNRVENLEWCTKSENIRHAIKTGLKNMSGSKNPDSKLNEKQVLEIRAKYIPKTYHSYMLAKEYGVSQHCIMLILQRKKWIHI